MPPKKKKSVKKKKKKGVVDSAPPIRSLYLSATGKDDNLSEQRALSSLFADNDFIYIELRLMNWEHGNLLLLLRTSSTLATIARKIEEVHGRLSHLQFFRSPPHAKNQIVELSTRLSDIGMVGGTLDENHRGVLYYNYKPGLVDALLLREPQIIMLQPLSNEEREEIDKKNMEEYGHIDA